METQILNFIIIGLFIAGIFILTSKESFEIATSPSSDLLFWNKDIEEVTVKSVELFPTGMILMWSSYEDIPDGFLECNGQDFDANLYPDLFNYLNGATKTPDLRGVCLAGKGDGQFNQSTSISSTAQSIGANDVVTSSIPRHNHSSMIDNNYISADGKRGFGVLNSNCKATWATITGSDNHTMLKIDGMDWFYMKTKTEPAGEGTSVTIPNVQKSFVLKFIIKT